MDDQVPGEIYLCQVNENVSCGACCGLYNLADPSRETLNRILARRTMLFKTVPRDADAIEAFGRQMAAAVNGNQPFPEFHHCPYLGLVGAEQSRVGCLLHPLADGNNGADFRGLSFYGGLACQAYFCPSCSRSLRLLKDMIRRAATDWYHYGLIITEADLLCTLYDRLRLRSDDAVERPDLENGKACLETAGKLLDLKITWPFQPKPLTDRVNYFFKDNLYAKPAVSYGNAAVSESRHHEIFKSLVSTFSTDEQLQRAETMIDKLLGEMDAALFKNNANRTGQNFNQRPY